MNSNGAGGHSATDTSGGMVGINVAEGSLTWTVSETAGIWDYLYVYTPAQINKPSGIGAINIQFGAQPTDLVAAYTYVGTAAGMNSVVPASGPYSLQTIDRTKAGSGLSTPAFSYDSWLDANNKATTNVDVTTTFQGIQWFIKNPGAGSSSITLELKTALAPIWGNFYLDGFNQTTNNGYGMLRNLNYDTPTKLGFSLGGAVLPGYLPVPGPVFAVQSTSPAAGATGAPISTPITVVFNKDIDPTTLDNTSFTVAGVTGTVAYDANSNTASFTPGTGSLSYGTSYQVTIGTGVKDLAGNALAAPVTWSFTTAPDTTPPAVTSTTPVDQATGALRFGPISAAFSKTLASTATSDAIFTVNGPSGAVSGTLSYDATANSVIFMPLAPLAPDTIYSASIAGLKDLLGNVMAAPVTWSFTTPPASLYSGFVSDISTDTDGNLSAVSNAWGPDSAGNPRGVRLNWDIDKLSNGWQYRYVMYGNTKAVDKWVNNIDLAAPQGFAASDLLPGWSIQEPVNGLLTDVTAQATGPGSPQTYTPAGGAKSINGVQWHIASGSPQTGFPADMFVLTFVTTRAPTWGDFLVESGVAAGAGTPIAYNKQFGTAPSGPPANGNNGGWMLVPGLVDDLTAPAVSSTAPAAGALDVPIGTVVTAVLSKDLDQSTVNSGTLSVAGVSGSVSYDAATRSVIFTPASPLAYSTTYHATLSAGLKDLFGNTTTQPLTWSFTTTAPADVPPVLLSATPAGGAVAVDINSVITATFSESLDPASVTAGNFGVAGVAGTLNYSDATHTVSFTPSAALSYYTGYTLTIGTGIKDLAGSPLAAPSSLSFTTAPLYGDGNSSGSVDVGDALMALRAAVHLVTPTAAQLAALDVAPLVAGKPHGDSVVDVADALAILRRVVGLTTW